MSTARPKKSWAAPAYTIAEDMAASSRIGRWRR